MALVINLIQQLEECMEAKGMEREKNDPDPAGVDGGPGEGDRFAYQFRDQIILDDGY